MIDLSALSSIGQLALDKIWSGLIKDIVLTFISYKKNNKETSHFRYAMSVNKKIGHAVVRNRLKRQVRAIIDSTFNKEQNLDMIVIVRNKFLEQDYETNLKDFKYLLNKINKEK